MKNISIKLSELATEALLKEASCFPSFGLVSPQNSGAHNDMTFFTFIESSVALTKYFYEVSEVILMENHLQSALVKCVNLGIAAEKEMFDKTNGINTHKGAIFLMGYAVMASAFSIKNNFAFQKIPSILKKMSKGRCEKELENLDTQKDLTHGEKIYLKYGFKGIRGEVESGIPIIFGGALKVFSESTYKLNERLIHTLTYIMSKCDDTTILYRHDLKTLVEVQETAINLFSELKSNFNSDKINMISNEYSQRRISPGGCADLLAATVFFHLVEEEFF